MHCCFGAGSGYRFAGVNTWMYVRAAGRRRRAARLLLPAFLRVEALAPPGRAVPRTSAADEMGCAPCICLQPELSARCFDLRKGG